MLSDAGRTGLYSAIGVTGWLGERVLGMVGVYPLWQHRAEAFALFSEDSTKYMLQCYNLMKYMLDTLPYRRVEMVVKVHNDHGHKLARHLGFGGSQRIELPNGKRVRADGLMQKYWPYGDNGADVVMYSRIRDT